MKIKLKLKNAKTHPHVFSNKRMPDFPSKTFIVIYRLIVQPIQAGVIHSFIHLLNVLDEKDVENSPF